MTTRRLADVYAQTLAQRDWTADPAQKVAIAALQRVHDALCTTRFGKRWFWQRPAESPRGVYLWGGVGRGKTFVMDLFHANLGELPARRRHFHRFMLDTHRALTELTERSDPLDIVAGRIAQSVRLLCLDEMHVNDIGDAMILGRLFERLFARDVVLVTTSNVPPSGLYRDGLQRARFMPAIAQLETHCEVLEFAAGTDYRLAILRASDTYQVATGDEAHALAEHRYLQLSGSRVAEPGTIEVQGRAIATLARVPGIAWFDFDTLCRTPRSAPDYIELATRLHTVVLSSLPVLGADDDNAARRFVSLIDEFYDRRVNLIITAAAPPDLLYTGERLAFEFQRTASRLHEMQSEAYLAEPHRS